MAQLQQELEAQRAAQATEVKRAEEAVARRQKAEQVRAAEAQAWQQAETALQAAAAEKEALQKIVKDLRTEAFGLHAAAAAEQRQQNKSFLEELE